MNITKDKIIRWFNEFESGENSDRKELPEPTIIRSMILAKVAIDRWNLITNHFIFNPLDKEALLEELLNMSSRQLETVSITNWIVWGTQIIFDDTIPKGKCLSLCLNDNGELVAGGRSVCRVSLPNKN